MSVKGSGRWRRHPTFGIWDSVSRILGDVFTGRNAMLHALYLVLLLLLLNTDMGEEDSWSGRWRKHPTKTILLTHFHVMYLLFKSNTHFHVRTFSYSVLCRNILTHFHVRNLLLLTSEFYVRTFLITSIVQRNHPRQIQWGGMLATFKC